MENNNDELIPNEYSVNLFGISYIVSTLQVRGLDDETIRELLQVYYDGLELNKAKGFTEKHMVVTDKPNLYNYLKVVKSEKVFRKPYFSEFVEDVKENGVEIKHIDASFSRINSTVEPMMESNKKDRVRSLEGSREHRVWE